MRRLLLIFGISLLGTSHVAAASCRDDVTRVADQYGLKIAEPNRESHADDASPPQTSPATQESRGLGASDTLAPSGGVIKTPPSADHAMTNEPPHGGTTPTIPAVPPQTSSGGTAGSPAEPQHLSAAIRSQAEALLDAARVDDAQGKSDECSLRVREAEALIAGSGG
jgi:hypothetical protein